MTLIFLISTAFLLFPPPKVIKILPTNYLSFPHYKTFISVRKYAIFLYHSKYNKNIT